MGITVKDRENLIKDLSEVLELPSASDFNDQVGLIDLGLDSLKAAEICALLEYKYDTVVPIEIFVDNPTIDNLIEIASDEVAA